MCNFYTRPLRECRHVEVWWWHSLASHVRPITRKAFPCQMCQMDLSMQSEFERQAHYEQHFSAAEASGGLDSAMASSLSVNHDSRCSSYPGSHNEVSSHKTESNKRKWIPKPKETDVFWLPAQTNPPPPNFSPGRSLHIHVI